MKGKGLTLVELLIVIGIITVLLGIVVAIVSEIRWRAGVTNCSSNLRQIGLALRMYAQDWNGFAPPHCALFGDFISSNLLLEAFRPYTKNDGIWICPHDPFRWEVNRQRLQGGSCGVVSYQVPSQYCSNPVNVDHPPPAPPKTYWSSQCAICRWFDNNIRRWDYAIDYHHRKIFRGPPGSWFTIKLLLNGRVLARFWDSSLHGCPARELPSDWPPNSYKDIP